MVAFTFSSASILWSRQLRLRPLVTAASNHLGGDDEDGEGEGETRVRLVHADVGTEHEHGAVRYRQGRRLGLQPLTGPIIEGVTS